MPTVNLYIPEKTYVAIMRKHNHDKHKAFAEIRALLREKYG